ncbi:MAG TPA: S8 family serine peptidase [Gemmatimonadales bacterium]|nr:S8 family serine peptidase [Gemmatimonadales bacterium]
MNTHHVGGRSALATALAVLLGGAAAAGAAPADKLIGIDVVLNTHVTSAILADLGTHGKVRDVVPQIDAVTLQAASSQLDVIRGLSYVVAANPDAEREGAPIDTVPSSDFSNGLSTWDQDAIDVTDFGRGRTVAFDGSGVYVAVIDTGLLDSWRQYFPEQRVATQYAKCFSGGGGDTGNVSEPTNCWQHDQNSHGTHVTSSVIGYSLGGVPINGAATKATIIPVKVLKNAGFGWSSVIARGILYVAQLKAGPLAASPVVINMSLGGPGLDAIEKAAIDYAIAQGVIVVAAAGNAGDAGMGYPGAYAPVISVAASGWVGEWQPGADGRTNNWWYADDVADPTNPADFYITDFSSREKPGQDLDVAAPGSWVVGPYQVQSGKTSYYFLGGTSMASPHVAGIAALMMQKNPGLNAAQVEAILEGSAVPLAPGCRTVAQPSGPPQQFCWGADATGAGLASAASALAATP